jgi:hypothetical protein
MTQNRQNRELETSATPYGLKPVKRADGMPYAGATSQYLIDPAGEATNLFYGQVVIIGADGYIALATGTGADLTTNSISGTSGVGAIGVFVGCEYVNAQGQTIFAQYYPSGTANGGAIKAYVVDDPNVLFQAQANAAMDQSDIGANVYFAAVQSTSTGDTATGNSTSAVVGATQTAAAAFRVVAAVSALTESNPDILVKFNPGGHQMTNNDTVNNYLTDTNAWFLMTDIPNGLKHFVRSPMQTSMDADFDTGNSRYKARERYSFGVSDPLGIFGSPGA